MAPRKSTCGPLVRHSYVYRAAAALPFTAQAQESVRRVAVLTSTTPDEPESQALQSGTFSDGKQKCHKRAPTRAHSRVYGNADATVVLAVLHGARLQSRLVLCPLFGDA